MKPVPHVCPSCGAPAPSMGTGVFTCRQCGSTYRVEAPVQPVINNITNVYHAAPVAAPAPIPAYVPSPPKPRPRPRPPYCGSKLARRLFWLSLLAIPAGYMLRSYGSVTGGVMLLLGCVCLFVTPAWMAATHLKHTQQPKHYGSVPAAWLYWQAVTAAALGGIMMQGGKGATLFVVGVLAMLITLPWWIVTAYKGKKRAVALGLEP